MIESRCMILFHSAIKSEATRKNYDYQLNHFRKHCLLRNFESLLKIKPSKIQEMLEDYVLFQRERKVNRSTINGTLSAVILFYSMNDVILNNTKLRKMLPERTLTRGRKPYTTKQIQTMLKIFGNNPKYYALTLFISSSGVRPGFSQELRIKDLTNVTEGCKAVTIYAGHVKEYTTFITSEANQALDNYFESRKQNGEKLTSDSWVFTKKGKPDQALPSTDITHTYIMKLPKVMDLGPVIDGRRDIQIVYGMRKRWNTIFKNNKDVNHRIIDKMFAHAVKDFPLDETYHLPTIEKSFSEYRKCMPELMISHEFRSKYQIQEKEKRINELENDTSKIESLQFENMDLKRRLLNIEQHFKQG